MSNYIDGINKKSDRYELVSKPISDSIADAFSNTKTYAIGDYVMYEGKLYRCKTAVTTAGNWAQANWELVNIVDDIIADFKSEVSSTYATKGDLSEALTGDLLTIFDAFNEANNSNSYSGVSPFVLNKEYSHLGLNVTRIRLNVSNVGTLSIGVIKKSKVVIGTSANVNDAVVKAVLNVTQTGIQDIDVPTPFTWNEDEYLFVNVPTDTCIFKYGAYGNDRYFVSKTNDSVNAAWREAFNYIGITVYGSSSNILDNTVRFDAKQTKTNDEKTQARENIGINEYHEVEAFYHPDYQNFVFTDEDGNVLGALSDPSDSFNPLSGKKLSILGDSISTYTGYIPTGYATYYPRGDVDDVEKTWWRKLIALSGMTILKNASWSGSRVSGDTSIITGAVGCSDARINELKNGTVLPDIIICYISTNDWGGGVSVGSFDSTEEIPSDTVISNISDAYALMLYKLRNTYPNADIYCVTSLEGRQTNGDTSYPIINSNGETIHQVNHAISEIAHIFGAKVIDLQTCGIHYWNVANYTVDGTLHPNSAGTTVIAETIYTALMNDYKYRG